MLVRILRRFPPALYGIWYGVTRDASFSTQFFGGLIVVGAILFFVHPLTSTELLFLLLGWTLLLITELQNSAVEAALDKIHSEHDTAIGLSKDMAAGAVLLAGGFFGVVVLSIVFF